MITQAELTGQLFAFFECEVRCKRVEAPGIASNHGLTDKALSVEKKEIRTIHKKLSLYKIMK